MQGIDNLPKGGGSSTLSGLADVNFSSLTQGDLLIYDGAEWINHSFTEGPTILDESGSAVTARDNLQFTDGLKVTDDSGNNKTKVGVNTTFTEAVTRTNIASGDTFSTILGKIKKWFTDLKAVAFSGSYNDLSDKPTIPVGSDYVKKSGDTMSGNLEFDNCGVNLKKGSYKQQIRSDTLTGNQLITTPNKSGTMALTSDIPTVPTKTSDLTNDSGFVTSTDLSAKLDKNGGEIFTCNSGPSGGGYKYCQVCTITTVGTYRDGATRFEFTKRGSYTPFHVDVYCQGGNTDDPLYNVYVDQADITAYMVKTATRTWKLLVAFNTNESAAHYISISLHRVYYTSNFKQNATVTIEGIPLTAFPTGLLNVSAGFSPNWNMISFEKGSSVLNALVPTPNNVFVDLDPSCERLNSVNLNNLPQKNKAIWNEINPNSSNLPESYWYYCLTIQGSDTGFASQFLLGMTVSRVWYRRKDGGTWQAWILIK